MLEMGYRTIRRGVEVSMEPIAVDKSRGAIAVLASVLVSLREPNPVDRETGLAWQCGVVWTFGPEKQTLVLRRESQKAHGSPMCNW